MKDIFHYFLYRKQMKGRTMSLGKLKRGVVSNKLNEFIIKRQHGKGISQDKSWDQGNIPEKNSECKEKQ